MGKRKHFFPINSSSFTRDVRTLFILSNPQIEKLIESYARVGKKRALFSTAHVDNVLKVGSDKASKIRSIFLYLVETIKEKSVDAEALKQELCSLGCEKPKVDFFVNNTILARKRGTKTTSEQ